MKKKFIILITTLLLLVVGTGVAYWYFYELSTGFRRKSLAAFAAVLKMGKSAMSDTATASEKEEAANAAAQAVADAHRSANTRRDSILDSLLTHELSNMNKFSSHVKLRTPESLSRASEDLNRVSACSQSIDAQLGGSTIKPELGVCRE